MTREEEIELINKIREGDKDLFRKLVDTHAGMIFSMLYKMTGNRGDAEDMAQETFVKAWFSLDGYRGESSVSTWLYSIAYHLAVSSLRKKKRIFSRDRITDRELQMSEGWFDSGEDIEMKLLKERQFKALEKAVDSLQPQERFLINAFYEEQHSLNELSQITGMTVANVKVRLFRCRNRIAETIRKQALTDIK